MFLGKFVHSFDDRSRMTVPSKFRDYLSGGAFVVQGLGKNLWVMTPTAFGTVYQRLMEMNLMDPDALNLRRLMLGNASPLELDGAGRILIPEGLRVLAELKDDAVLVGQGDYFEVWSPENWQEQEAQVQATANNPARYSTLTLSTR